MPHYYDPITGKQVPSVLAKGTGKPRATNLRDARELGLGVGTTSVTGQLVKEGLDIWKLNKMIDTINDLNPCHLMLTPESAQRKEVWKQYKNATSKASARGTDIHNKLEMYYKHGVNSEDPFIQPIIDFIADKFPSVEWESEATFFYNGYGGQIDLLSRDDEFIILDFKTKDTDDIKKMIPYSEHHMQTAAYVQGVFAESLEIEMLNMVKRYNLFASTQVKGLLNLTESTEYEKDIAKFNHLLDFWKLENDM